MAYLDQQLVTDFAASTPRGLEAAYRLWARTLALVAGNVLHDASEAEDCVHDALLRVWRSPRRFNGDRTGLRAYLVVAVRNEALAVRRSRTRQAAREERAARLAERAADAPLADPIEAQRVREALARLPGEQRRVLEHAFYGNKTHAQISTELNLPLGTVKSRIAMALRKLHAELRAPGYDR